MLRCLKPLGFASLLLAALPGLGQAQVNRSTLIGTTSGAPGTSINNTLTTNGKSAITGATQNALDQLLVNSVPTLLDQNTFSLQQTFSAAPVFTSLNGCLAANLTGAITGTGSPCGSGGGGSPGGSTNAVQYNAGSGNFGGVSLSANQLLEGSAGAPTALSLGTGVATALADAANASGGFVTSPIPLSILATQATNSIVANTTSGTASPTAVAVSSCSAANDALIWTTNTGPGCSTSLASLTAADQTLSGGATVTSYSIGTESSGTYTPDCGKGPLQYGTNGGAFSLAVPANDGSCIIRFTNNGSAGTITLSGSYHVKSGSTGDTPTTTNTYAYDYSIWEINGVATYMIHALQ